MSLYGEKMVAAAALASVPCACDPAYYERGLAAPDCRHHDLVVDMAPWVTCICEGCERLPGPDKDRLAKMIVLLNESPPSDTAVLTKEGWIEP